MENRAGSNGPSDSCAQTYGRIAPFYDLLDAPYEYLWKRRLRARVFARTSGRILDAGVGTGRNMAFYPPDSTVVAFDVSRQMLDQARQHAARLRRPVMLLERDISDTRLPDATFDSIVTTFVLCCLPPDRQREALRELRRLVSGTGTIQVLDYTLARQPALRAFMHLMGPWLKLMFSARYDSQPEAHFRHAGLAIVERHGFIGGGVVHYVLRPC
jgi:ubiquinone/menaquinone biosynthesis C-methylase UbiE